MCLQSYRSSQGCSDIYDPHPDSCQEDVTTIAQPQSSRLRDFSYFFYYHPVSCEVTFFWGGRVHSRIWSRTGPDTQDVGGVSIIGPCLWNQSIIFSVSLGMQSEMLQCNDISHGEVATGQSVSVASLSPSSSFYGWHLLHLQNTHTVSCVILQ